MATVFSTLGCATASTNSYVGSSPPAKNSNARAAAYTVDGFQIDKKWSSGKPTDFQFFYKECELSRRAHFTKADYDCFKLGF